MSIEPNHDALAQLFSQCKDHRFVFVKPGGNYGDDLIYWGAEFLAEQLGLRVRSLALQAFLDGEVSQGEVVYIHGGGGYNRWCSGAVLRALDHALGSPAAAVIQGPCTLEEDAAYITDCMVPVLQRHAGRPLYFMARERVSFRLASDLLKPFCTDVLLAHDSALRLTRDEVFRRAGPVSGGYRLYGFRQDNESGDRVFAVKRLGVQMDPAYFCRDFVHWVRVHAGARQIITNRTHSSILGAILGTHTTLFPSRYHKNRSVWAYSLQSRGVHWSDGDGPSDQTVRNDVLDYVPPWLSQSYKVERLVRFLQGVPLK